MPEEEQSQLTQDDLAKIDILLNKAEEAPQPSIARVARPSVKNGASYAEMAGFGEAPGLDQMPRLRDMRAPAQPHPFDVVARGAMKVIQPIAGAFVGEHGVAGAVKEMGLGAAESISGEGPSGIEPAAKNVARLLQAPFRGALEAIQGETKLISPSEMIAFSRDRSLSDALTETMAEAYLNGDTGKQAFWATVKAGVDAGADPANLAGIFGAISKAATRAKKLEIIAKLPEEFRGPITKAVMKETFLTGKTATVVETQQMGVAAKVGKAKAGMSARMAVLPSDPLSQLSRAENALDEAGVLAREQRRAQILREGANVKLAEEARAGVVGIAQREPTSKVAGDIIKNRLYKSGHVYIGGEPVYHGTDKNIIGNLKPNITLDDQFKGISLEPNRNVAKGYGKNIYSFKVKGELVDFKELNDALGDDNFNDSKVRSWLKRNGYVGVDYTKEPMLGYGIRVMDSKDLIPITKKSISGNIYIGGKGPIGPFEPPSGQPLRPLGRKLTPLSEQTSGVKVMFDANGIPIISKAPSIEKQPLIQIAGTSIKSAEAAGVAPKDAVRAVSAEVKAAVPKFSKADADHIAKQIVLTADPAITGGVKVPSSGAIRGEAVRQLAEAGEVQPGMVRDYFEMSDMPDVGVLEYKGTTAARRLAEGAGIGARETIVNRAGEAGQRLVDEYRQFVGRTAAKAGEINYELDKVLGGQQLPPQQSESLALALEGSGPLTPEITESYNAIRKVQKTIYNLRKSQDPEFNEIANYMNHSILPDEILSNPGNPIRQQAIVAAAKRGDYGSVAEADHMLNNYMRAKQGHQQSLNEFLADAVKRGNADDLVDAKKKWEFMMQQASSRNYEAGSFKRREFNLPWYDPDPMRATKSYVESAMRDLYITERYGKGAEKYLKLAHAVDTALDFPISPHGVPGPGMTAYDRLVGRFNADEMSDVAKGLTSFQIVTKMNAIGSFKNLASAILMNARRTNLFTAIKADAKTIFNYKKVYDYAQRVGQKPEMSAFTMEPATDIARRYLESWLSGKFNKTEMLNYMRASQAGRMYAQDTFANLVKKPSNMVYRNRLRLLGIDPEVALKQGQLTLDDLKVASNTTWRETQSIPDIMNQPHRWLGVLTTSPTSRIMRQYQSTAYASSVNLYKQLFVNDTRMKRASNVIMLGTLFPITGELINTPLRALGIRQKPKNFVERWTQDMEAVFGLAIYQDIYNWNKYGGEVARKFGQLLGPTAGDFGKAIDIANAGMNKGGRAAIERTVEEVLPRVPGVGPIVGRPISRAMKEKRVAREEALRE